MAEPDHARSGVIVPGPPVLTTDRLILRVHEAGDLDAAAAMWADPDVCRHIRGKPFLRQDVWFRILRYRGHWTLRPFGYWAVTERDTGRFLGEIGLADWKRESVADLPGVPEMGWVLPPAAQGLGYAAEALDRVLAWADEEMATDTVCVIADDNTRSIRLAEQFDYRRLSGPVGTNSHTVRYCRSPESPTTNRSRRRVRTFVAVRLSLPNHAALEDCDEAAVAPVTASALTASIAASCSFV